MYVTLSRLCETTGEARSTILAAILRGEIEGYKRNRSWRVCAESYTRWVEAGERGGDVGNPAVRTRAPRLPDRGQADRGPGKKDEGGGEAGGGGKGQRRRRRKPPTFILLAE